MALPFGYIVGIATGAGYGFFSLIQWIVIFTQLMRYLNRIKPTSILTGTSFQSVSHHFLHGLAVYLISWLTSGKKKLDDYLIFFIILISIVITNMCCWKLNRDLKSRKLDLDSEE